MFSNYTLGRLVGDYNNVIKKYVSKGGLHVIEYLLLFQYCDSVGMMWLIDAQTEAILCAEVDQHY